MEDLPVDINYSKLIEWLTSRKKLVPDWRKRLSVIQSQTSSLSKTTPSTVTADLPVERGGTFGYFSCKQILERLAEASEKTIFGGLTGSAREWEKVLRVYTKGNVYLGEVALTLASNVDYEIPLLRKQVATWNGQLTDFEKKEEELMAAARAASVAFRKECKALSIKGQDISSELQALVKQLPSLLTGTVEACQDELVGEAVQFYSDLTSYSLPDAPPDRLVTLLEVRDGTTAPPAPDVHNSAAAPVTLPTGGTIDLDLDLGALGEAEAGAAEPADHKGAQPVLDWDIGIISDSGQSTAETVNWDIDVSSQDVNAEPADINWDIDVADAGIEMSTGINWGVDVAEVGTELSAAGMDTHATSKEPLESASGPVSRLVHDVEYRNALQDNLAELQAFLTARSIEGASSISNMLMATAPESLQRIGQDHCWRMLESVGAALRSLNHERVRQLLLIKHSPQYMKRMLRSLELKASQEGRLMSSLRDVQARRSEVKRQMANGAPKVKQLVERTQRLKESMEQELGAMVRRQVNIIGEINVVLKK